MQSFINVRIGRLPGRISEITLNGDRTVATALMTAGLDSSGYEIRVQGQPASTSTGLNEGDIVLLVKKIKGNGGSAIEGVTLVQVGRVPGSALVEFALDEPTVYAALQAAGITLAADEVVYVLDQEASVGMPLYDGDKVVVRHRMPATATRFLASEAAEEKQRQETAVAAGLSPIPGAENFVRRAAEPAFAPATVDFSAVPGIDPAVLRSDAERLVREADELEAGARAALASAAEKKASAEAHRAKASAIETSQAALSAATVQLEDLGVIRPQGKTGRLADLRKLFGL